ncbi:MAG: hypothetical protein AB7O43_12990 [Hyphomicrobiaceae bacterium]
MAYNSARRGPVRLLGALVVGVIMLVVELILTMTIYTALNLFMRDTFGHLVALSKLVGDLMINTAFYWLPSQENAAYASLIGDFSPKAILLLLIGLVVAALLRGLTALLKRAYSPYE